MNHSSESMPAPERQEAGKEYKEIVKQIKELNWESLNGKELQQLMYLSYVAAQEFAEALRIALKLYPNNANLTDMAHGELGADNLEFDDYSQRGDHADFLRHFLKKYRLEGNENLKQYGEAYRKACAGLDDRVRAMTIFSREEELSGIFREVLNAKDWSGDGLSAFQYYLETHIELDSEEGGHADLTKEFPVDDSVKPFYESRLEMYRAIPTLFNGK